MKSQSFLARFLSFYFFSFLVMCGLSTLIDRLYFNLPSQMLDDYSSGLTPNPDVLCNREIKFHALYEYCRNQLGAAAIATGHYAQLSREWTPDTQDGKQ